MVSVRIHENQKKQAAEILERGLLMESRAAERLVSDGVLTSDEFYAASHSFRAFPSPRSLANTPAARLMAEAFGARSSSIRDFYEDFFEKTVVKAVDQESEPEGLTSNASLKRLDQLLQAEVRALRPEFIRELLKETDEIILKLAETAKVETSVDGNVIKIKLDMPETPMRLEPVERLMFEDIEKQAEVADNLYKDMSVKKKESNRLIVHSVNNIPIFPDKEAYVRIVRHRELEPAGAMTFDLSQIPSDPAHGLPALANPTKSFQGTIRLVPGLKGGVILSMEVRSDPDMSLPNFLLEWTMADQIKTANVKFSRYLAQKEYFEKCINIENQDLPGQPGISASPCYR